MEDRIKFVLKILIFVPLGLYILVCTFNTMIWWFFGGKVVTSLVPGLIGLLGAIALVIGIFVLVILFFRWLFDID